MGEEGLTITFLDEDDNEVRSERLPLVQEGDEPPAADGLVDRARTSVTTRQSTPLVVCHEADDTLIAFQAGDEILKVTGPPLGSGAGKGNINLQTQPGGAEAVIRFELWNSTGGPCRTKVEIPGTTPPYRVKVAGETGLMPFHPASRWSVLVRRVVG